MKLAAIVGTNATHSYNRRLLKYMQRHFAELAKIEILEINQLPLFQKDLPQEQQSKVWDFKQAIKQADGVIFSSPEYDHSIPAALKSAIEWLSYHCELLDNKPVMIVGASYGPQGSARAQEHLRQILASPDLNAAVLSGNEFLLGNVATVFNEAGELIDKPAATELEKYFTNFVSFAKLLNQRSPQAALAAVKQPLISGAFVQFPTGKLSLQQIQQIFSTMPFEVDFIDETDHFSWFSDKADRVHVRSVSSLGETVQECHPPLAVPTVEKIITSFKSGEKDLVERCMTLQGHKVLIRYYAVRDVNGHYLGTMEFTGNVDHLYDLFKNGSFEQTDTTTGASQKIEQSVEAESADTTTSATPTVETEVVKLDESTPATDATSGASQHQEE
ncbi:NAD(P)H-dependent oxidoreductase [Liquorilactobacillus nagelii]|uniref:NAD(P)H-dependent oxidoreductase n=1 Tax=Liquorilactobacillus nagelii TaxID=82688 RepID=UPI0024318A12|nr:NAD(P)H-dependent oxidoreductase [Liquorilactobacillus nagelii]MCI1700846.1 NAD(P)H-dependent oxidoreductase [Liquorilactobacillus nagelii]